MPTPVRVDFHCHSSFSDGALPPDKVADALAAAGVAYAALADHDTLEGLEPFRKRLAARGVGFLTAVEMTVDWNGRETHLLGFGFDPDHAELRATLAAIRERREPKIESIADSVRTRRLAGDAARSAAAPDGRLSIADGIALLHRAGGGAFLAHPLLIEPDLARLEEALPELQAAGLDGLEALYAPFLPEVQEKLLALARRHNLLAGAGSDFHDPATGDRPGVDMPADLWKAFRDAILRGARRQAPPAPEKPGIVDQPRRFRFIFGIVLPAVIAMLLFAVALLDIILPAIEESLLDRKREMLRELVNVAWDVLAEADQEARSGVMSLDQAKSLALRRIESMRYGRDGKDYFWVQDMHPRLLMHPYRPDLAGHDVSDYRDPRGARIFVVFADLVRRQQEGFIGYVWQWQDDAKRQAPKESYIRGFAPWGWIIGTGLYTEDVHAEIARFERHLTRIAWGIAGLIGLLLLVVIRQGLLLERKRREAETSLREATDRYRALVEAAAEGTLLLVDGRCRYANPTLLRRLGYSPHDIELLDLTDVLPPREPANEQAWIAVRLIRPGEERAAAIEAALKMRDGHLLPCHLFLSRILVAGKDALVLQVRDPQPAATPARRKAEPAEGAPALAETAANLGAGLLRARPDARATLLDANTTALSLIPALAATAGSEPALADAFPDTASFDEFRHRLDRDGQARRKLHAEGPVGGPRTLTLDARLVRTLAGDDLHIDALVLDTTADERRAEERDALLERLQTSLLYLHEPVEKLCRPAASCETDTPLGEAAALMTAQDSEAALVREKDGSLAGILTDRLIRIRALVQELPARTRAGLVMRPEVAAIPRATPVYEALLLMQEKGVEHLAVLEPDGGILGLIHSRDILQLHSGSSAAATRAIARAPTAAAAIEAGRRTPALVRSLLDTGAHARQITRLINGTTDAVTIRLIELALAELGPPPRPFAFLALGSQGRQEPTLVADQDNALVYAAAASPEAGAEAARYFLALGEKVCAGLDRAGYPFCLGGIMARNPKWCASLPDWIRNTEERVRKAEPKEVMDFTIFLDFRTVYGDNSLVRELRDRLREAVRGSPPFLPFLALDLLRFEPPPAWFVRLIHPGRHPKAWQVDLKAVMMPLSGFARLYALKYEIDETQTLGRLEVLARQNRITPNNLKEIATAFDFLLRLRLRRQMECVRDGLPPDNAIDRRRLDRTEQLLLRQAYHRIAVLQKKIQYDFLGGGG